MTPLLLGLIGLALSLPVPALLARTTWPLRAPRAGVVLWQSLALAAVLALFGAGFSTALWLVSTSSPSAGRIVTHFVVLALTFVVGCRFWWSVWTVWRDTQARRRRHRELVDLLGEPDGMLPALRVLHDHTPIAYCVPGRADARVVVSRGTIDTLDGPQLAAVLEHERAHVTGRHDLVLEGFTMLHKAFPRVLRTDAPLVQSQIMVELLADDAARRITGPAAVAHAIVELAGTATPVGALGAGGSAQIRLARLAERDPRHLGSAIASYVISAVVLVVPTVFIAIPWIIHAWLQLDF